ncbi:rpfC [Symbiodinium pilosum]|uniref:histidine kinase n=1 Tax=Symbiodinium pilosum TaxID=2952 RepID=A0A812LPD6_SYMPI|nr:rpfC [Symbiodinium pilosum]
MMDASKLVHRRNTVLTRDPVQLSSIVQEVMLLCQEAVDKRGEPALKPSVKIVNAISQPLPVIEADAYRCTQLFFNLISNAVKFTNKGSVTISAAADDVEQYVGIAPDCLERIFQPFDQEDRSEQRHYEGLGLGLAICRQIVAKHGGSLTVTSHKNKGSTFRVKLPYRMKSSVLPLLDNKEQSDTEDGAAGGQPLPNSQPSPAPEAPETTSVADPDDIQLDCRTNPPEQGRLDSITSESVASIASRASFGRQVSEVEKQRMASIRMKTGRTTKEGGEAAWNMLGGHDSWVVLSVDDDMVNQQVMSSLLRSSKYKIEVATHGGEALSYMREHPPPALILMEVMMPGLSGTDVLRTLRKTYSLEVLPIIMISAKSDKETIARCLNLGANDFVQKPFNLAEMFARVNLHCRLARAFRGRGEKMPTVEPQVDDDMVVEKSLLKELLPGELLQAISSAASSTATKVTREVARSRVEEFLSKRESPSTVHADQDMQAKLVKAEKEAKQAVGVMDKLSASQGLMKRGESARLRLLEEEVRKREQCLLHFGQWRDTQTTLPPSCVGEQIVKNVIRAEETLLMKDVNISHILASLPAAEAAELQDTLTRLREETLLLLQESSCKDQLLLDANFRLHMLGMTLVQKDIQLGLRSWAYAGRSSRVLSLAADVCPAGVGQSQGTGPKTARGAEAEQEAVNTRQGLEQTRTELSETSVTVTYDKTLDCLVWPGKRHFTLRLADCQHRVRWKFKDNGGLANEWERCSDGEQPSYEGSWGLDEDVEQGLPEMEPMELSCDDLESLELDKSQVSFQIVTCGKDRFNKHHMQEQAIVFDVRDFHDPGAGELKFHDGRHDEIISRILRHSAFPELMVSMRRRIVEQLSQRQASIKIVFYCKSGRHRSVACGTLLHYILFSENFRKTKLEHEGNYDGFMCCHCGRCEGKTAKRMHVCEDALRAWKKRRTRPS